MKITSVVLHPIGSSLLRVLSFKDPKRLNIYNVKNIIGLDADEIIPKSYGDSSNGYYDLSLAKRDIVVLIDLNPRFAQNETYSSLRDNLYKLIASGRTGQLELQFKNGNTTVAVISGLVTKLEASIFSKSPMVQISISCSDPMLKSPTETVIPAVNALNIAATQIVDNVSTAPHGFKFEIKLTSALLPLYPTFRIKDTNLTDWSFEVAGPGGYQFLFGDTIMFSSEVGNRYIKVLRLFNGPQTFHLADQIVAGSVWPTMFPGVNNFGCTNANGFTWQSISYYNTYWGI